MLVRSYVSMFVDSSPGEGEEVPVTYKLMEGATSDGKTPLVDSLGYKYNKKTLGTKRYQETGKCTWHCSVQNKALMCPATVCRMAVFSSLHHISMCIQPNLMLQWRLTLLTTAKVKVMTKEKNNIFKSRLKEAIVVVQMPTSWLVMLIINARKQEPRTLDSTKETVCIPKNFLQRDIKVDRACHLVFATRQQPSARKCQNVVIWMRFSKLSETPSNSYWGFNYLWKGTTKM